MSELYCVPLGYTARRLFYKKLETYGDEGLLVLPNAILQKRARAESHANCCGIDWLADQILGLNDNYKNFHQISRRTEELIIKKILDEMFENNELEYFCHIAGKKNFAKEMTSLMIELARSGVTVDEFSCAIDAWESGTGENEEWKKRSFCDEEWEERDFSKDEEWKNKNFAKDKEIALIYAKYRDYLKAHKYYDIEGKYRLAIEVLEDDDLNLRRKLRWKQICLSEFFSLYPQQLTFIGKLSNRCEIAMGLMYEEGCEDIFKVAKSTYSYFTDDLRFSIKKPPVMELTEEGTPKNKALQYVTQYFRKDSVDTSIEPGNTVRLWEFSSREDEMRWVITDIKRLLHRGEDAKDILVIVRDFSNYNVFRHFADEYGIPVTLPKVTPLSIQPLSEFVLLLFTAAADNRHGADAYLKILSSAIGKLIFEGDTEKVDNLRLEKYYTSRKQVQNACQELQGRDCKQSMYENDSITLVNEFIDALAGKETFKFYTDLLRNLLGNLGLEKKLGEEYKKGKMDIEELQCALRAKIKMLKCLDVLEEDYIYCGLDKQQFTAGEACTILSEALDDKSTILKALDDNSTIIKLDDGHPDGVLVTEIVNIQGTEYKYVYIMGMRQGEFPLSNKEKWPYSDKERGMLNQLGIDMPGIVQAFAEEEYLFAATLSQATEQLTLSWHKEDSAKKDKDNNNESNDGKNKSNEDKSPEASYYILQLKRMFQGLNIQKPERKVLASPQEFMMLGHECDKCWLKERIGEYTLRAADTDRIRKEVGFYNGKLEGSPVMADVVGTIGNTFSATELQAYADCPFKFLGKYLWKQNGFDEKTEELDSRDEGNLLHKTLEIFLRNHLKHKLGIGDNADLSKLEKELESDFEKAWKQLDISEQDVIRNAEKSRLLNMLKKWLYYECAKYRKGETFVPVKVECNFGQKDGPVMSLESQDGERINLRGCIDRIDSDGNKLLVIDYKTSRHPSWKKLNDGLDMQMPVYALAANASCLPGTEVAGGGYFVLKDGKWKNTLKWRKNKNSYKISLKNWQEFKDDSKGTVLNYINNIFKGDFSMSHEKKCDNFCPMRSICRITHDIGGEENE